VQVWSKSKAVMHTVSEPMDVDTLDMTTFSKVSLWTAILTGGDEQALAKSSAIWQVCKAQQNETATLLLLRTPIDNLSGYMTVVQEDDHLENKEWHSDFTGQSRDAISRLMSPAAVNVIGSALADTIASYLADGKEPEDFGFEAMGFTLSRTAKWPVPVLISTKERQDEQIADLEEKLHLADEQREKAIQMGENRLETAKEKIEREKANATEAVEDLKNQHQSSAIMMAGAVSAMIAMAQDTFPSDTDLPLPGVVDPTASIPLENHDVLMRNAQTFLTETDVLEKYTMGEDTVDPINTAIYHIARQQSLAFSDAFDNLDAMYQARNEAQETHVRELQARVAQLEGVCFEKGIVLP